MNERMDSQQQDTRKDETLDPEAWAELERRFHEQKDLLRGYADE